MIDLNDVAYEYNEISRKREENGAVDSDVLKHCAGEIVEAVEAVMEYEETPNDCYPEAMLRKSKARARCIDELMDVFACVLIALHRVDEKEDYEKALKRNLEKNRNRALGIGDKL